MEKKMYGTLKAGHNNFASQKFHILKLVSLLNGLQWINLISD